MYEKTLGVLGFGRIGQLVAARARAFGMRIVAFDPFVSAERFRELGADRAETAAEVYAQADFITVHLPRTPDTRGFLDAEAFAAMRDGVRVVNCARGELIDDARAQGRAGQRQGRRVRRWTCSRASRSPTTRSSTATRTWS